MGDVPGFAPERSIQGVQNGVQLFMTLDENAVDLLTKQKKCYKMQIYLTCIDSRFICVSIHKRSKGNADDYFGGIVEVLISRSVWNVTGETDSPCIIAHSILSAARQISSRGMWTDVREGLLMVEMSVLS